MMGGIALDPYLLLMLIALLYTLGFGVLGLVRREGLSAQFALEALGLTALFVGGAWLLGLPLNPFVFLLILYLVTMRSRLAVDLANLLARRRYDKAAFGIYKLALAWWPDASSRLIIQANRGAAEIRVGKVEDAIQTLEGVLAEHQRHQLGLKYEAACRFNLGYAYEKAGEEARAMAQYHEAIEVMPGSLYAKAAQAALKRRTRKGPED